MVAVGMLAFVLALVAIVVVLAHLVASSRNAVPPVFTPPGALDEVTAALDLPERGQLVDLGCGDGRVLAAAVASRPGLKARGMDNNPVVLGLARWRLGRRARLGGGDILKADLHEVDRVFVYLGPGLMKALEPKFENELPKGARVVSQQFALPGRKPERVVQLKHGKPYAKTLYVYDY